MTNTKVTNYLELIEIESFRLHEGGLEINYTLFGQDHSIPATPATLAADLLKEIGFIEEYSGAGDEVAVEYERDYSYVDYRNEYIEKIETIQQHWLDFVEAMRSEFSDRDALSIAALIEAKKEAQRAAGVFTDIKTAIDACTDKELTEGEKQLLQLLSKVPEKTIWGYAIKNALKNPFPSRIRTLFKELKEQARDDEPAMKQILGNAYYPLLTL